MDRSPRSRTTPADAGTEIEAGATPDAGAARETGRTLARDGEVGFAREADLCGGPCPLNFVKTKILLGQLQRGQVLSVLLDRIGAERVSASTAQDGHRVLSVASLGDQWRVLIEKA